MAASLDDLKISELSVFLPCYNEEKNIANTVKGVVKVLESLKLKYEVIVVNDGSKDKSGEVAEKLAEANKNIRVIHHEQNMGYGTAVRTGFNNAKYDWIAFTDSDGQFDFSEITNLIDKTDQADVVVGYRINRQDPWFRKLNGWGWTLLANVLLGVNVTDVDCAFKLVNRKVIKTIPTLESSRGGMISPELMAKVRRAGFKVAEVGVHHYPRVFGEQTGANISVILKSFKELFQLWWKLKDNKWAVFVFIGILALAAALRFYKLDQYMNFLGDEGRDALMVRRIWTQFDLPLIGPPSSVGDVYLGPLYYYMMAIPMLIFWMNPIAATAMVALIGVLTVGLVYYITQRWFGEIPALVSSFLYAISPITIIYSRSSWNPNPAPFFTLIAVWGFYMAHQTKNYMWFIATGIFTAAALQMHYLTLLLLPLWGILWLVELFRGEKVNFLKGTLLGILTFFIVMSPLIIFDLNPQHFLMNYHGLSRIFAGEEQVSFDLLTNLSKIPSIYINNLIGRYVAGEENITKYLVGILTMIPLAFYLYTKKSLPWVYILTYLWLLAGLLGSALYQGEVYDHYLGYAAPAIYILLGGLISIILELKLKVLSRPVILGIILVIVGWVSYLNLLKNPLQYPPNNQLERTQEVVKYIIEKADSKPFNLGMVAERNYDAGYRFYFDVYGYPPKVVPEDITEQLFVVCEDPVCKPINNAKYDIAAFGWSKVEYEQDVRGVKVFKLLHNRE